jgi:hypothetical protein
MTTTSTKQTIIYHPNRTPWTQERPRHLQSEQSYIIWTELPEHKKDHDIYKQTIIYHPNSLNTRPTKQTIIYHPNRTPWTQERPRHLQNEQSSIILNPWTQERPRHLQNERVSIILTPWTQDTPGHLQNKQSCIILTELPENNKDQDIYKTNNHLSS